MANMGYCRFQNTLSDLQDCNDHLYEDLSEKEERARTWLVKLCKQIAEDYWLEEDEDNG